MKIKNLFLISFLFIFLMTSVVFAQADNVRIAMVVKNLGNAFFEACHTGGLEAVEELGGIELIFQAPVHLLQKDKSRLLIHLLPRE